jgi:hypothetical protein
MLREDFQDASFMHFNEPIGITDNLHDGYYTFLCSGQLEG